jgi:hypothetical protein
VFLDLRLPDQAMALLSLFEGAPRLDQIVHQRCDDDREPSEPLSAHLGENAGVGVDLSDSSRLSSLSQKIRAVPFFPKPLHYSRQS